MKRWVPGSAYGPQWPHVVASQEEGVWEPDAGYEFVNNTPGDYTIRALPQASAAYLQGLSDRNSWEQWFGALTGEFQAGALWWSAQRSLPKPSPCRGSQEFEMGCEAARVRLASTDVRRKSDPEYKRGWNAYSGGAVVGQTSNAEPATFEQGEADRTSWERWFAGLTGEFQEGAYWWSGQRSLSKPGACTDFPDKTREFVLGCEAAKAKLAQTDLKRKSSEEYKKGWNEYSGPVVEPNIRGVTPPAIQNRLNVEDGAADKLNAQELRRLKRH